MTPRIFLRHVMNSDARFSTLPSSVKELSLLAHFYILAEDETIAGDAAGLFSLETGLECTEYGCMPQPIERAQIAEHEAEYIEAYELAARNGFAVVLNSVCKWYFMRRYCAGAGSS